MLDLKEIPHCDLPEDCPEPIRQWVEALESGEYAQTTGALRKGNNYCCLGVACDKYSSDNWKLCGRRGTYELGEETSDSRLIQTVKNSLFLRSSTGSFRYAYAGYSLFALNDSGFTFSEIVRIIRYCYVHPETEMFL